MSCSAGRQTIWACRPFTILDTRDLSSGFLERDANIERRDPCMNDAYAHKIAHNMAVLNDTAGSIPLGLDEKVALAEPQKPAAQNICRYRQ